MKEFLVTCIAPLTQPDSITDADTGETMPTVSLEITMTSPANAQEVLLLHFPPQLLRDAIPKLSELTRLALTPPTDTAH